MIAIKHRFTGATLCEFDVATVREAAENGKANLRGANLYGANLYGANLRGADLYGANLYGADLYGANLCGANLCGANLYGVDLCGADLRGADLRGADLGKKGKLLDKGYFSLSPVGSRQDTLQAFHTDKGIWIKVSCFFDSLQAFREAVGNTHGDNDYGFEYQGIANLIEFHFTKVRP